LDQPADQIEEENKNLAFSLQDIAEATVLFIAVSSLQREKEMLQWFKETFKTNTHFILDVASEKIDSLYNRLQLFQTTNKIRPLDFVHVIGLENSFSRIEDKQSIASRLIPALNYDRELFFKLPFHTVLWGDKLFFQTLNRLAPDFTHWVTKWFEFCEPEPERNFPELPRPNARGKIPTRSAYIDQLEQKYQALDLNASDKPRLTRDKISLLTNLADEYENQSDFNNAISKYQLALEFAEKINDQFEQARLKFKLGSAFLKKYESENALIYYQSSLALFFRLKDYVNSGRVYHQMGMAYAQQRNWTEALHHYTLSINYKTDNEYELGGTFHQMGMVYEKQQNWHDALHYYALAIENKQKTGNNSLGGTYHQIGMVYQKQGNWPKALNYYFQAFENKQKMGNEFALGSTYHQIGMVYAEQRNWLDALHYYGLAIENKHKMGNEYALGSTYYQMGIVYKKQGDWLKALNYYNKAVENKKKTGNELDLGIMFHQLGMIYEEQGDFKKTTEYYQLAIENLTKFNHPALPLAMESVKKLQANLTDLQNNLPKVV
jgi:tetratricopeptide (TPR) repeat protein